MRIRKIVSFLIALALAALAVVYYRRNSDEFWLITQVSLIPIGALFVVRCALFLCNGLQLKIQTDCYQLNLSFVQWFGLSRLNTFSNLFLPLPAGASLKAVYLKKWSNLPYGSFILTSLLTVIIKILTASLFGVLLILLTQGRSGALAASIAGGIFAAACAFLCFSHRIAGRCLKFSPRLAELTVEWQRLLHDQPMLRKLLLINCVSLILVALDVFLAFQAFSVTVTLSTCGTVATFSTITATLNLLPGNLGIRELVFAIFSKLDSVGINEGLHAAALSRVIATVSTLLLMPGLAYGLAAQAQAKEGDLPG